MASPPLPDWAAPLTFKDDTTFSACQTPLSPSLSPENDLALSEDDNSGDVGINSDDEMITPVQYKLTKSNFLSLGRLIAEKSAESTESTESTEPAQVENNRAYAGSFSKKSFDNLNAKIYDSEKLGREKRASILHEWGNNDDNDELFETPTKAPSGRKHMSVDVDSLFERLHRDCSQPPPAQVLSTRMSIDDDVRESSELGPDESINDNPCRIGGAFDATDSRNSNGRGTDTPTQAKGIKYGARAASNPLDGVLSSPYERLKTPTHTTAIGYGARAASSPLVYASSPYEKPEKPVRRHSVVRRAISNEQLRKAHENGGFPTTPADADLYRNKRDVSPSNHLPAQLPSKKSFDAKAKDYGELMRSKIADPIKPTWVGHPPSSPSVHYSKRIVAQVQARRMAANRSPNKKADVGNHSDAIEPVLDPEEVDEGDGKLVAELLKTAANAKTRRLKGFGAQRATMRPSQTITQRTHTDFGLDVNQPAKPKPNILLRLFVRCCGSGAEQSEADENEFAARVVEDFESYDEEDDEQRIERIRRSNLRKANGQPMLVGDIRAATEFERRNYALRLLRPVGALSPNLFKQLKEMEAGQKSQVKLTGITVTEFLLWRYAAEKMGARPAALTRKPRPYAIAPYNLEDDVAETANEFLTALHQAERRGLVTAPEPTELKHYNLTQYSAGADNSALDDLARYNRMAGYHNVHQVFHDNIEIEDLSQSKTRVPPSTCKSQTEERDSLSRTGCSSAALGSDSEGDAGSSRLSASV